MLLLIKEINTKITCNFQLFAWFLLCVLFYTAQPIANDHLYITFRKYVIRPLCLEEFVHEVITSVKTICHFHHFFAYLRVVSQSMLYFGYNNYGSVFTWK